MTVARFLVGDVFDVLKTLPDNSVDLVLTSPPFFHLRSYLDPDHPEKGREVGQEPTPSEFIDTLLDVVEACERVLAPHGSIVIELGDSRSGSGGGGGDYLPGGMREGQNGFGGTAMTQREGNAAHWRAKNQGKDGWPMDKSLCFIPQVFGASLAYGRNLLRPERTTDPWRVRNVVYWCRPNPSVGALGDKFRDATSHMTMACKSRTRYFDLDAVRSAPNERTEEVTTANNKGAIRGTMQSPQNPGGAPPLDHWWYDDVFDQDAWLVATAPYKGAHYASWNPDLLVKPILAMCPPKVCIVCGEPSRRIVQRDEEIHEANLKARDGRSKDGRGDGHEYDGYGGFTTAVKTTVGWTDCGHNSWRSGVILDPFGGSGTTGSVGTGHGRNVIMIDIDERNADLAVQRIGMFCDVSFVGDGLPLPTWLSSPQILGDVQRGVGHG